MNLDTRVLRAMLRLARRRKAAYDDAITVRVDAPAGAIRAAIRRLDAAGFVELRPEGAPRLTLSGLALAVALVRSSACAQTPLPAASRAA
jgi:Mn-dependent DtxR family transcriptional regulator